jgi:hypothetical protein
MHEEPELSDGALLEARVESDRLTEQERQAFEQMQLLLPRRPKGLSHAQRNWAKEVYRRLDLAGEEPCANLYSQGVGRAQPETRVRTYAFENLALPDKPPGRRHPWMS